MKHIHNFVKGAVIPFRALKLFSANMKYWRYISVPVIINFLLYSACFFIFWQYILPLADNFKISYEADSWYAWAAGTYNWLIGFTSVITMCAVSAFTFIYVLLIIEAPFLALLSERIEKDIYGNEYDTSGVKNMVRSILLGIKNSIILGMITLFWTLFFFVGNFILPGVSTVIGILVIGYYYGVSFLVYSAELRFISYTQLRRLVKGSRMEIMGLGAVCYLVILVPFVAVVFLPIAVVGGVILYNECLENTKPRLND